LLKIKDTTLTGLSVDMSTCLRKGIEWRGGVYDPWTDAWTDVKPADGIIAMPSFRRSVVIRWESESQRNEVGAVKGEYLSK